MIREERDAAFWRRIADHPEVAPHVSLGRGLDFDAILAVPGVIALATEHGGQIFAPQDALGRTYEMHTLFTPEGWGREVATAAKAANEWMRQRGAQVLTTYQVAGNWRSQPPKTHGWRAAGDFAETPLGSLKTWVLLMSDWLASPAYLRFTKCP